MDDEMDVLLHNMYGDHNHKGDLLDDPPPDLLDDHRASNGNLLDDPLPDLLGDSRLSNTDLLDDPLPDLLDGPREDTEPPDQPHHGARDEPKHACDLRTK